MQPLFVHPQIGVGEHTFDDFSERQRHDGQIVAVEAQNRNSDEESKEAGQGGTDHHRHPQSHRREGDQLRQPVGGGAAQERTDAHKARVAQGELSGYAYHQIQGQGHGHISTDGDQLPLQNRAQPRGHPYQLEDHKGAHHQGIGKCAGPGGLIHICKSVDNTAHSYHLTLSRARSCPADRRASPAAPRSARRTPRLWTAGWRYRPRRRSR